VVFHVLKEEQMLMKTILASTVSLLLIGPPRIAVQTTNQTGSALATIDAHFHTEEKDARVYATLYSWAGNQRTERTVALARLDEHRYRLDRTWVSTTPVVVVVGVEQGEAGKHGVAEALIRVARDGRVAGVDVAMTRPIAGSPQPRRVNDREIEGALEQLGARVAD
jgi:hypothetical protein